MICHRTDWVMRQVCDVAISAIQRGADVSTVATQLREHMVPEHVAHRVALKALNTRISPTTPAAARRAARGKWQHTFTRDSARAAQAPRNSDTSPRVMHDRRAADGVSDNGQEIEMKTLNHIAERIAAAVHSAFVGLMGYGDSE